MSHITSDDVDLQAFTETMNEWAVHVLGHKDFDCCTTAQLALARRDISALETIFRGYCAFRSGAVNPTTWAGVTRIAKILMSTKHFMMHWEKRKDEFPQDFCDFMSKPRVS